MNVRLDSCGVRVQGVSWFVTNLKCKLVVCKLVIGLVLGFVTDLVSQLGSG